MLRRGQKLLKIDGRWLHVFECAKMEYSNGGITKAELKQEQHIAGQGMFDELSAYLATPNKKTKSEQTNVCSSTTKEETH